jgi:hypothetical protein
VAVAVAPLRLLLAPLRQLLVVRFPRRVVLR